LKSETQQSLEARQKIEQIGSLADHGFALPLFGGDPHRMLLDVALEVPAHAFQGADQQNIWDRCLEDHYIHVGRNCISSCNQSERAVLYRTYPANPKLHDSPRATSIDPYFTPEFGDRETYPYDLLAGVFHQDG